MAYIEQRKSDGYMTGSLIVAMPFAYPDVPQFSHSVIYLCGHDSQGAIGLMLNRIHPTLMFQELLVQIGVTPSAQCRGLTLHYGGNTDTNRGFVLHSPDVQTESTVLIQPHFALTSTIDMLRQLAEGMGPESVLVNLGYTAWAAGQLDNEIQNNQWMIVENPHPSLVFGHNIDYCWGQSLAQIGVDPGMLSIEAGHA